jgi:hypothetical protein
MRAAVCLVATVVGRALIVACIIIFVVEEEI